MLNYRWVNAMYFLIRPSKYISKLFKQIGINLNFFRGTFNYDEEILDDVRVPRDVYRYHF